MALIQKKLFIVELGSVIKWKKYFPFYAHVWGVKLDNDYTGFAAPELELENIGLNTSINVLSFTVRQLPYLSVTDIAEVIENEASFLYDVNTRFLYIHFLNNDTPYRYSIGDLAIGLALGFYSSSQNIPVIIDNVQYQPRLKNNPELRSRKDDTYYSKQVFSESKIELINDDFSLSPFTIGYNETSKLGNFVRIYFYEGDGRNLAPLFVNLPVYLWNTLNNESSVESSEVGSDLSLVGTPTFGPGRWGYGVHQTGDADPANAVYIPGNIIPKEDLSFEFWYTRTETSAPVNFIGPGDGELQMVRLESEQYFVVDFFALAYAVYVDLVNLAGVLSRFPLNESVHIGITHSNSTGEIAVFFNGTKQTVATWTGSQANAIGLAGFIEGNTFIHGSAGVETITSANGVIDNLKIWDFIVPNWNLETQAPINLREEDLTLTFQGLIEEISEGRDIEITLRDIRKKLNKKTPTRYLDTSLYPHIVAADKNFIIPKVYGKVKKIPCLCLNENVNKNLTSNFIDYQFLICDTSFLQMASDAIAAVYIDGVLIDSIPTITINSTENIATFTLGFQNFQLIDEDEKSTFKLQNKVSIDTDGYIELFTSTLVGDSHLIENSMEIVRMILMENYNYGYTSVYYDLTTWSAFELSAYKIGLYLKEPKEVYEIIGEIAATNLGQFLWNEDLKFSWDTDDFDVVQTEFTKQELLPESFVPKISTKANETLYQFRIGFNPEWSAEDLESKYIWIVDTSNQERALIDFNSTYERNFETLINNEIDVEDYRKRVIFFGGISDDRIALNLPWRARTLRAGEWIAVEIDLPQKNFVGWVVGQIYENKPKPSNWTCDIDLRIFKYGYKIFITTESGALIQTELGTSLFRYNPIEVT